MVAFLAPLFKSSEIEGCTVCEPCLYFVSNSAISNFNLDFKTSLGPLTLPRLASNITLAGRQSKVIVTDYSFGASKVLYTTTAVLFAGRIGNRDVLFLHGDSTQEHEAAIRLTGKSKINTSSQLMVAPLITGTNSAITTLHFSSGINGLITVWDSDTQLILFSDSDTAGTFFSPVIPGDENSGDTDIFKL